MWKRRVVNKHHRCSCCGQKHVCTYVVGGRVGMNETCYFTFDMKKLVIPPHPTPPEPSLRSCVASAMCSRPKKLSSHPTPPHPTPASGLVSHRPCVQGQRTLYHPTPPHPTLGPDLVWHRPCVGVVNPRKKVSESNEKSF